MLKRIILVIASLLIMGLAVGYYAFSIIQQNNVASLDVYELLVPEGASYDYVKEQLITDNVLVDPSNFELVARLMKYNKSEVPTGRYVIKPGMSNRKIVTKLRAKHQDPIKLTFSQARYIQDIAGQAGQRIMIDSAAILAAFTDLQNLSKLGLSENQALSQIIPNTYEVFWDISAQGLVDRMQKEYLRYWDQNNRKEKADKIGLSLAEVSALAAVVEKESIQNKEKPTIAGVYLNRIKSGIPLAADPTVVYAIGDFDIRRVLKKHLEYDSPYNTYKYPGIPPGPICMPSMASIDAVLNAESHDYLFFCAKPGYNGAHLFAKTNAEHERNASVYHKWLNKEGIFK